MIIETLKRHLNKPRFIGRRPSGEFSPAIDGPDWVQASPARIETALQHALAKPDGGWFALDASSAIGKTPQAYEVDGQKVVLWRDNNGVYSAPEACPHMGASLANAPVEGDSLVCPWHGLKLSSCGHGAWRHYTTYDDGVLVWIQLDKEKSNTQAPIIADRPSEYLDGVIRMEANCDPEDIIANRLDPWHGCHFHPYSFAQLKVIEATTDFLKLRVAYRVVGPLMVEVDATFHTPDPRTIVMTIVDGDGIGSVVETHATPISPGRCVVLEATLATSDRAGFHRVIPFAGLVRPYIKKSAERLWVDDIAYAERLYALRQSGYAASKNVQAVRSQRS